jgi:hypothetical protein
MLGQKGSKEFVALSAEPGCDRDSNCEKAAPAPRHRALTEFQGHITTPTGWLVLSERLRVRWAYGYVSLNRS